jgi:hypothetical protein
VHTRADFSKAEAHSLFARNKTHSGIVHSTERHTCGTTAGRVVASLKAAKEETMIWKIAGSAAAGLALLALSGSVDAAFAKGRGGGHHGGHHGGFSMGRAHVGGYRAISRVGPARHFAFRHHRHFRHRRVAVLGGYSYYYGNGCYWLKQRALYTGNPYWWRRYQACRHGYSY